MKSGDTLSAIARRFDVTTAAIVQANKLTDPESPHARAEAHDPAGGGAQARRRTREGRRSAGTWSLTLKGAPPGERITFTIVKPGGRVHRPAPPRGPDGTVTTSYTPGGGDLPGAYVVRAHGDQGTDVQAVLQVEPA